MKLGNIPSKLSIKSGNLVKSGLGAAGDFFSDIMNMWQTSEAQKTSVAVSQAQAIRAQAEARAAAAQAAAVAAAKQPGMSTQTQLLLAGAAVAGLWFLKPKPARRRR